MCVCPGCSFYAFIFTTLSLKKCQNPSKKGMKAIRCLSSSVSLRGPFNCIAVKSMKHQYSLRKGVQALWEKAISTRPCRAPLFGCICCKILSDTIFTVVWSLQPALAPWSEGIHPSNRAWQVSFCYNWLGHWKVSSVCCRQFAYCLLFYICTQIFYRTFLDWALFLSLDFFLLSYLTALSLTASASLPHSGIYFLVSFLAVSGLFICLFICLFHYPYIPWILFSFSICSVLFLPALLHWLLFVPLVLSSLLLFALWCISSITFSLPHIFSSPIPLMR